MHGLFTGGVSELSMEIRQEFTQGSREPQVNYELYRRPEFSLDILLV